MAKSFFLLIFGSMPKDEDYKPIPVFENSEFLAIPARPSTSQLIEDLMVDPEALKMETHEPGIYDEDGDYIPMYSDDPKDLENISPTSLDAPELGETAPASVPASDSESSDSE